MRKPILLLPVLLFLMIGCHDTQINSELDAFREQEKIEAKNTAVIKKLFEEINQSKNIDIYDDLCDTNYLYYSPSFTRDPLTLDKVKAFASMVIQAFPDVHYTIEKIFADGEYVIVWNVFSGTHEGTYQGIPATGNKIEVSSVLIFRLKDGKIVEEREEADMLGALMQLGMELQIKKTQ